MLISALLALTLGSPPEDVGEPLRPFDPVRAAVTVDEDGTLEILAFDEDGAMLGALLAVTTEDHVQIDASFADGHASMAMVLDPSVPFIQSLHTDLPAEVARERVTAMFGFVDAPGPEPQEGPTRRRCMLAFAAIATVCGGAAFVPGVGQVVVVSCAVDLVVTLCDCAPYLPVKIC